MKKFIVTIVSKVEAKDGWKGNITNNVWVDANNVVEAAQHFTNLGENEKVTLITEDV